MITTVGLAFTGCDQEEALIFILAASLYYVFNSLWYVLVLRCIFAKWCDRTFANDEARCCENMKYLCCGNCGCCCRKPTYVRREAEVFGDDYLSKYSGKEFKTLDGTACLPIRLSADGKALHCFLLLVYAQFSFFARIRHGELNNARIYRPSGRRTYNCHAVI